MLTSSFFPSKLSSWNAASDVAYECLWHGPWISKGPGMARSSNEFQWVPCWPMPNNSDRCWLCRLLRLPIVRRFLRTFGSSNCSAAARQHRDMSAAKALWSSKLPMQAWTGRQEKNAFWELKSPKIQRNCAIWSRIKMIFHGQGCSTFQGNFEVESNWV